jgi:hypothetical protein
MSTNDVYSLSFGRPNIGGSLSFQRSDLSLPRPPVPFPLAGMKPRAPSWNHGIEDKAGIALVPKPPEKQQIKVGLRAPPSPSSVPKTAFQALQALPACHFLALSYFQSTFSLGTKIAGDIGVYHMTSSSIFPAIPAGLVQCLAIG